MDNKLEKIVSRARAPFVFGCAGVTMEVLFNATNGFIETRDMGLRGHSYAWMFPIWAAAAPTYKAVVPKIKNLSPLVRGMIYGATIMAAEYILGTALREAIGKCPWSEVYNGAKYSVHDLVRLDFYPFWCMAGLGFEALGNELYRKA